MKNRKRRKFQKSVPLDDSNGTAPKRSRREEGDEEGGENERPRSKDETRVMPTTLQSIPWADANDSTFGGRRLRSLRQKSFLESRSPETLLNHVLASFPAVSGVLSLLPLKEWLLLRRVSKAWKTAVDIQLRSLKVLDFEELLEDENEAVKILLVLRLMSEKAPGLREIRYNFPIEKHLGRVILLEMKSFKSLTVLDLRHFFRSKPSPTSLKKIFDLVEHLAENLEELTLPRFNISAMRKVDCEGGNRRLELMFSRLRALRKLVFLSSSQPLQDVLLALPHPEKLQRLWFNRISDTMLQLLQRCSQLKHLKMELSHGNVNEQLMVTTLSQLQTLTSLETGRRRTGMKLSVECLRAISGMERLEKWKGNCYGFPEQAVSWGGWGFQALTNLNLLRVGKQCHLDTLNQIPSLMSLHLQTSGAQLRLSLSLPLLQSLHVQAFGGVKSLTFDLLRSATLTTVHLSTQNHSSFGCLVAGLLRRSPRLQELRLELTMTGSKSPSIARNCPSLEVLDLPLCQQWPSTGRILESFVEFCPHIKTVKMRAKVIQSFHLASRFPNLTFQSI